LGNVVVLPGLINPHVHLELSHCVAGESVGGASFTEWITSIRRRMNPQGVRIEEAAANATRSGIEQCLKFGVTTVGDISGFCGATRDVLRASPLRAVSFGEVLGLAKARPRAEESLRRAIDDSHATERLRIGITPHAPYTVDLPMYQQCIELAHEKKMPLATHLAESNDEREFLMHHAGPFRAVWDSLDSWAEPVTTFSGSPIEFAAAVGLLEIGALLAHVNYCDDEEMKLLSHGRASVVYCPRTHRYFGHPPHRWRAMLNRGINVAVGTDSCASSPNLNILDELRLLRQIAPEMSALQLFELVTLRAARALHMDREIGSLVPGKVADLVAFESRTADPLNEILTSAALPSAVWIAGERVTRATSSDRR
jgi:cytosine/adenosine deaminase-related metal-dependent hydrolase